MRGTLKTGKLIAGTDSAGSGLAAVAGPENVGCCSAATTGATYMNASTARPIPAHQYRIPLNLNAVNPNGCSAQTDAYDDVASPFFPSDGPLPSGYRWKAPTLFRRLQ
jgi:hypothetical protein